MSARLSRRHFLKAGLGAIGTAVLTACTPATTKAPETKPTATEAPATVAAIPEEITIKYLSWTGMAYEDSEREELLDPFEAENPNIKVELEIVPYGECWKKLLTLAAANDLPDFFSMCALKYADWLPKGVLLNLEPFIATLDKSKYYFSLAEILRAESDDPNLYAIPFRGVIEAIAINKDALAAAGVDWPDKDWSWEDLLEMAKKITQRDDDGKVTMYGYRVSHGHGQLDATLNSNGGEVLDKSLRKCMLDSPVNIETIQFLVDFIYKWKVSPNPAEVEGMGDPFLTSRLGIGYFLSYQIQTMKEIEDFSWDIWWWPRGTVKRVVYGGPDSMSISKDTPYQEECLKLMRFALSEKRGISSFGDGSIPFLKSKTESKEWLEAGNLENKQVLLDMMPYIKGADFGLAWSEWRSNVMNNELAPAFLGEKSVEDAVKSAAIAIQAVLDEAYG